MAEKLTDEESKEVFTLFDKNEDGRITTKELGAAMRSLGLNPTKAELRAMVEEVDEKTGGEIDYPLFLELLERKMKTSDSEDALRDAFRVFDKDQKGSLSVVELKHIMTNLGEKLSEEQVEEMIADANVDEEGQVNYSDLCKVLMSK